MPEKKICQDCLEQYGKEYEEGSFACKIRHQQISVGHLKRERESNQPNFGLTEQH